MKPCWRLDRPDWRAADRALLSGIAICMTVAAASYLSLFVAQSGLLGDGASLLGFAPLLLLFLMTVAAAKQPGVPSFKAAFALSPLRFDLTTAAFAIGALSLFYGAFFLYGSFLLFALAVPGGAERAGDGLAGPGFLALLIGLAAMELFLRGYLFTRIARHAGDLYALAVSGVFGGAVCYGAGLPVVLQATVLNLFLGWARAGSGTVALPLFLSFLMAAQLAAQPFLLSWFFTQ